MVSTVVPKIFVLKEKLFNYSVAHHMQNKNKIFALYLPPDCKYIVHLSELRYLKNLSFSISLSGNPNANTPEQ